MNQTNTGSIQNNKRTVSIKWIVAVIISSVLLLLMVFLVIGEHQAQSEEHDARQLLKRIIQSVNTETEFYKNYAHPLDIKEVERHRDIFSDKYEIELIESDPGYYEYSVIFDGQNEFFVVILITKDGPWFGQVHFRDITDLVL